MVLLLIWLDVLPIYQYPILRSRAHLWSLFAGYAALRRYSSNSKYQWKSIDTNQCSRICGEGMLFCIYSLFQQWKAGPKFAIKLLTTWAFPNFLVSNFSSCMLEKKKTGLKPTALSMQIKFRNISELYLCQRYWMVWHWLPEEIAVERVMNFLL